MSRATTRLATRWLQGLNKFNAPEVLGMLFKALEAAGLEETADQLRKMGVPKIINEAWMQNRTASTQHKRSSTYGA